MRSDLVQEKVTSCYKRNIFHILEIQVPLWLVIHMCWPCFFSGMGWRGYCASLTRFLFLKTGTHCNQRKKGFMFCYKTLCSCFSTQKQPIGISLAAFFSILLFSHSVIMDSTPPLSKRIKTRVVRSWVRLEGWFSGDNELIEKYRFETSRKVINNPKVVSFG